MSVYDRNGKGRKEGGRRKEEGRKRGKNALCVSETTPWAEGLGVYKEKVNKHAQAFITSAS